MWCVVKDKADAGMGCPLAGDTFDAAMDGTAEIGLAVLANGGELLTGTQFCHRLSGLARTLPLADLVVTGCTELTPLDRGGDVVTAVSDWAGAAERPCIVFTTATGLARRELRTLGVESAHVVGPAPVTAELLTAAAARIAAGWLPGAPNRNVD